MIFCISLREEEDKDLISYLHGTGKSAKVKQSLRFWLKMQKKFEEIEQAAEKNIQTSLESKPDGSVKVKLPTLAKIEITKEDLDKKLDSML